ncbi:SixA phosphatase family protein [Neorhodopirellula pilleata]|nr:histidine phosphatase family protein [Neorhodopirellula pilleata]
MRHAKSDWSRDGLSDHDRPLNDRGRRDAPEIAQWIDENGLRPDLILCSSAVRTRQTAELMLEQWGEQTPIFVSKRLYLATPQQIFNVVREDSILPDEDSLKIPRTVLLLAHNPGISEAVGWLTRQMIAMPTAALAVMNRDLADWTIPIEPDQMKCLAIIKPKELS